MEDFRKLDLLADCMRIGHKIRTDKTLGYEYFCDRSHPLANASGKVYWHRYVAHYLLGSVVGKVVHHKDGNKANNAPSNLEVMESSEHTLYHQKENGHAISYKLSCDYCSSQFEAYDDSRRYCSLACSRLGSRKVKRPSARELEILLSIWPYTRIGKHYGVSDNAVRKWARSYGII